MNASQLQSGRTSRRLSLLDRRSIWLFAIATALLTESLFAQNPLRAQATPTSQPLQHPHTAQRQAPAYESAVPPRDMATSQERLGAIDRIMQRSERNERSESWATATNFDGAVERVGFAAPANVERRSVQRPAVQTSILQPQSDARDLQIDAAKSALGQNFIERENNASGAEPEQGPTKENIGQLISKLGMNLAFVLFLALGSILAVKQWVKPKPIRRTLNTDADSDALSMQIVETLRIDTKTTLHLVECGTSSILVATDAAGLKSVNLLSSSFDRALLEDAAAQEDQQRSDSGATPRMASQLKKAYRKETEEPKDAAAALAKSDGMDEKLIRMLLESSKKRKVAS